MSRKARLPLKDSLLKSMYEEAQSSETNGPAIIQKLAQKAAKIEQERAGKNNHSDQPSTPFQHLNPASQSNTTSQHHKSTPHLNNQTPQVSTTAPHLSTPSQHLNPASQSNILIQQNNPAPQGGTTVRQVKSAPQTNTSPEAQTVLPVYLDTPAMVRTPAQKRLLKYLEDHGDHVSNYDKIVKETGLRYGTARDVLKRFEEQGIISKAPWARGCARGIKFTFHGLTRQDNTAPKFDTSIHHLNPTQQVGTTSQHNKSAPHLDTSLKIDRKNLSISLSAERITLTWPNLHRAGFGPDQIVQIDQALAGLGKPADKVIQSLDHAEWELANDAMRDKDGKPVADPCSWVFTALARTGYYRRPKGYVSPEEQAAKDEADELEAIRLQRARIDEERFLAWKDGLSEEEIADAMSGHPGGPKDAWLKTVWAKKRLSGD